MTQAGYSNYEEYRTETRTRQPHTADRHRQKLIKKLDKLYSQRDYRALEELMELADLLGSDADTEKYWKFVVVLRGLLRADDRHIAFCQAFLR